MKNVLRYKQIEPIIGLIDDFEEFINKMEKRKEQLEELKDDLLIYTDPEFLESLKRAEEDVKAGRIKVCKTSKERRELFNSL